MKYALVIREYAPWNKVDEYYTRRKELALSDSYESLEKVITDNKLIKGNEEGQVKIIER